MTVTKTAKKPVHRFDGSTPGPGRPKGSKNKLPTDLRKAVMLAAETTTKGRPGGSKEFQRWLVSMKFSKHMNERQSFTNMVAKLIPKALEVNVKDKTLAEIVIDSWTVGQNELKSVEAAKN